MPFDPVTGVFTRVANSFSNPVVGTTIEPLDADALFDDYDAALNDVTAPIYYAEKFGVLGNGGTYTTQLQNLLNVVLAAGGGKIVLPAGSFSCGALTYTTATAGLGPGLQLEGQGPESTQIIFTGASGFLLTLDSTVGWQGFATISGFKITGNGVNAGGISLHQCAYTVIEDMHILTTGSGIYNTAAGDPTSTFQTHVRRVRFDNCATTAGTFGLDIFPSGTAAEISHTRVEDCQFEANGVPLAVANPPTSGAMRWRGLVCQIVNTGFTANNNIALYVAKNGSPSNLTIEGTAFENTTSTIHPHLFIDSPMRMVRITNSEILNNDAFKCQGGYWFDSTTGVQGNITIDGIKVRVSTGNNPFVAFRQLGTVANWMVEFVRVRNINWATYDGTGQTRFSGFQFDPIPGQCRLTVSAAGTVKLAPTGCGSMMPMRLKATGEYVPFQISPAGITAAGLTGLSANTPYYFFLQNTTAATAPIIPQVILSAAAPVLDATYGYLVGNAQPEILFIGMFMTNGAGDIVTTSIGYSQYPPANAAIGQIPGTLTNDAAIAGNVGEYVESIIVQGSAAALTTATSLTLTSISLTAGDWDVDTVASFVPANTTSVTQFVVSLGSVAATLNATAGRLGVITTPANVYNGTTQAQVSLPPYRISISATTTVYMIVQSTFTVSTNVAYGIIRARRVR